MGSLTPAVTALDLDPEQARCCSSLCMCQIGGQKKQHWISAARQWLGLPLTQCLHLSQSL
eukprot:3160836-Rhodomonas_salina.2